MPVCEQFRRIAIHRMQGDTCQRDNFIWAVGPAGEYNLELVRGDAGILIEGFEEVADLIQEDGVLMLRFDVEILLSSGCRHGAAIQSGTILVAVAPL